MYYFQILMIEKTTIYFNVNFLIYLIEHLWMSIVLNSQK